MNEIEHVLALKKIKPPRTTDKRHAYIMAPRELRASSSEAHQNKIEKKKLPSSI
jgi:hypothetical protein